MKYTSSALPLGCLILMFAFLQLYAVQISAKDGATDSVPHLAPVHAPAYAAPFVPTFAEDNLRKESDFVSKNPYQYIKAGKFNVHYLKLGSGLPLVLVHGGGTWSYSFREAIARLSQKYTVYAIDSPGHGYTETTEQAPESFSFEAMDELLLDFMDRLKISKAVLVGHSWGGGLVLHFTEFHQDRVLGLVLIGANGVVMRDDWQWELLKIPVIGKWLTALVSKSFIRHGLLKAFFKKQLVTDEMVLEVARPFAAPYHKSSLYFFSQNLDWKKTQEKLATVQVPTQIIWGKEDLYLDYKDGEHLSKMINNSKFQVFENCGHCIHEECFDQIEPTLLHFFNSLQSSEHQANRTLRPNELINNANKTTPAPKY